MPNADNTCILHNFRAPSPRSINSAAKKGRFCTCWIPVVHYQDWSRHRTRWQGALKPVVCTCFVQACWLPRFKNILHSKTPPVPPAGFGSRSFDAGSLMAYIHVNSWLPLKVKKNEDIIVVLGNGTFYIMPLSEATRLIQLYNICLLSFGLRTQA